jgi:hypothetical protein
MLYIIIFIIGSIFGCAIFSVISANNIYNKTQEAYICGVEDGKKLVLDITTKMAEEKH